MFPSRRLGLFDSIPCPDKSTCTRNPCLFSHQQGVTDPTAIHIPLISTSKSSFPSATGFPAKSILKSKPNSDVSVPAKRTLSSSPSISESPATRLSVQQASPTSEPPRKIQRLDGYKKAQPVTASSVQPVCLSSPSLPILFLSNPLVITVPVSAYLSLIHLLITRLENRFSVLILQQAESLFQSDKPV